MKGYITSFSTNYCHPMAGNTGPVWTFSIQKNGVIVKLSTDDWDIAKPIDYAFRCGEEIDLDVSKVFEYSSRFNVCLKPNTTS